MATRTRYRDVVAEVAAYLAGRAAAAERAGVGPRAIIVDPGLGFAKTPGQSYALLQHLRRIVEGGYPVLVGPSRKGFIGDALRGAPPRERLFGTAAAVALAVANGARLVRVHDVREMVDVVRVVEAARAA
jgi:dihydropteroate synthase